MRNQGSNKNPKLTKHPKHMINKKCQKLDPSADSNQEDKPFTPTRSQAISMGWYKQTSQTLTDT